MHKINRFHIYFILLAAIFIHLTVLDYVKIFGAKPDLVLIAIVFFSLFLGWAKGLEAGIIAGFIEDALTLNVFWTNTFALGLTGFIVGALNEKIFRESKATQCLVVFTFTVFSMAMRYVFTAFMTGSIKITFSEYLITSILLTAAYTAVVSVPIYSKLTGFYGLGEEDEDLI